MVSSPTFSSVSVPRLFRGFPWWLPLITTVIAAVAAGLLAGSTASGYAADARIWVQTDTPRLEQVSTLFTTEKVLKRTLEFSGSELSVEELEAAIELHLDDQLFSVTVTTADADEAEHLVATLAQVAVQECHDRSNSSIPAEVIGLSWPGARPIGTNPADAASLSGVAALFGGIGLAAALSRRRDPPRSSALALLGRRGWRPLAMIGARQAQTTEPPLSAKQLADSISASLHGGATTLFLPLHADADASIPALQAARALAGRGLRTLWIDLRNEQPVLLGLSSDPANPPPTVQSFDFELAQLLSREERLQLLIAENREHFDAIIVVSGALDDDEATARAADRVVLAARDGFNAEAPEITETAARVESAAPVLGIALTHASSDRVDDFAAAAESIDED